MQAFMPFEKYIVKEFFDCGAGVLASADENVAMSETSRRRNVDSYNLWFSIELPERGNFLLADKPMSEQSSYVIDAVRNRDFLKTLFIDEVRDMSSRLDSLVGSSEDKWAKSRELYSELMLKQADALLSLPSGLDFFKFVLSRCNTHDSDLSSSLIYSSGIKGVIFNDAKCERILVYNAQEDIEPVNFYRRKLSDCVMRM